jgi:hypothetical protein
VFLSLGFSWFNKNNRYWNFKDFFSEIETRRRLPSSQVYIKLFVFYRLDGPLTTQQQSSSPQSQQRFITVEILSSQEKVDISVEGATVRI